MLLSSAHCGNKINDKKKAKYSCLISVNLLDFLLIECNMSLMAGDLM